MKAAAWLALSTLLGCAGVEATPAKGTLEGRITTSLRPEVRTFFFQGRTYVDERLRVDDGGGVADAAVFLEGQETARWVSGKVSMPFGPRQFEPRVAFVSPGEPIEIGDTRDDDRHECQVNLKLTDPWDKRIVVNGSSPAKSEKPDRISFECLGDVWKATGNVMIPNGRTKEITFDRPGLVPLDWD